MKAKLVLVSLLGIAASAPSNLAQTLPTKIKTYLDKNYKGWKLSPTKEECAVSFTNKGFVISDFNGDEKLDYAVKFTKGKKGYILAFLKQQSDFKAFTLHKTDAEDVNNTSLGVMKKGETFYYEFGDLQKGFRLAYDAPIDYVCESDVGGIHYYRNGKFIAY
jgi:hypothetical protein